MRALYQQHQLKETFHLCTKCCKFGTSKCGSSSYSNISCSDQPSRMHSHKIIKSASCLHAIKAFASSAYFVHVASLQQLLKQSNKLIYRNAVLVHFATTHSSFHSALLTAWKISTFHSFLQFFANSGTFK